MASALSWDGKFNIGNALTIAAGIFALALMFSANREANIALSGRIDKGDQAIAYLDKRIDAESARNAERWNEIRLSLARLESRVLVIGDAINTKDIRRVDSR